jgi:hypothetical protein
MTTKQTTTTDAPSRPKRLTLSEIVEMTLAKGGASKASAVSLSRNAAGQTLIEVTVATGDGDDAATIEDAERRAGQVYARLLEAYPMLPAHDNSALTLSRNAKGETQVEVTTRTSETLTTVDDLADKAAEVYDRMRGAYPMANGTSGKPGSVA